MQNQRNISKSKEEKLKKAKKDFLEIWKKVQPFIKKKKTKEYSTTGKWRTFDYGL